MKDGFLHQVVYLLEPVGLTWLGLLILTVWLTCKRQRGPAIFAALLAIFVTIIGSTSFPDALLESLEKPYANMSPDAVPTADAIVMLGGGAEASRFEVSGVHLTPAGDRIVMANELFRRKKAPVVLLGGNANLLDGVLRIEGVLVKDLLTTWGIPPQSIVPLSPNEDTHDEALKTTALAKDHGWHRLLLVTSACHMRRASAVFRAQGLKVIPVPCNFLTRIGHGAPPPGLSVPRYDGFLKMSIWLHEEVGWWTYRQRGWITPESVH